MSIGKTPAETIALAEAVIRKAMPAAERDPFRPVFHFRAPARWMNDICGALTHEGTYHIFYQHSPFTDLPADWGSLISCWGHARSQDLLHWEHLPIAIAPSQAEGIYQCASGCATHRGDGTPMLFYGHTPLPRDGVRWPRRQWAALPLDPELLTWRTFDIGLAPGKSGVPSQIANSWTDMFVFREQGRAFAIFKASDGLVCEAKNPELDRWQAVGRIEGVEGECPNMVKLQDRWVLLRSTYPMTYQVGSFDPDRIAFVQDGPRGVVDYAYGLDVPSDTAGNAGYYRDEMGTLVCRNGAPPAYATSRGYYATNPVETPDGRVVLFAWVGAFRPQGWNGCMSLPRVLSLDADSRLVQTPIPELVSLRDRHAGLRDTKLDKEMLRVESLSGRTLEVVVDFALGTAERVVLLLQGPADEEAVVKVVCDRSELTANGTVVPRLPGDDPHHVKLHLFYDRSVMELFIDGGRQTVTRVAYPASTAPLHVECRAIGGEAAITALDVWDLKAVWPTDD